MTKSQPCSNVGEESESCRVWESSQFKGPGAEAKGKGGLVDEKIRDTLQAPDVPVSLPGFGKDVGFYK